MDVLKLHKCGSQGSHKGADSQNRIFSENCEIMPHFLCILYVFWVNIDDFVICHFENIHLFESIVNTASLYAKFVKEAISILCAMKLWSLWPRGRLCVLVLIYAQPGYLVYHLCVCRRVFVEWLLRYPDPH